MIEDREHVAALVKKLEEIPTLPQMAIELVRCSFEEDPDIGKVATLVEQDATLTAKLFKTVNSAAFGLRCQVKNVRQALSILGLESLRALIISIAVGEYFIRNTFGSVLDGRKFYTHSLATAVISREMGRALGVRESDQLFLIGLTHDLGKIALDTLPDSRYDQVLDLVKEGKTFETAEEEIYSLHNREVWRIFTSNWKFPSELIDLFSGTLQGKCSVPTLELIESASNMAEFLGYSFIEPLPSEIALKFDFLENLNDAALQEIGEAVHKQIELMGPILDLPAPDSQSVLRILFRMVHRLSNVQDSFKRNHLDLEFKVEVLQELARVFTGIIKSLHSESVAFSVLEAMMDGFHVNGAFLLTCDAKKMLSGFAARNDDHGDAQVDQIRIALHETSPSMKECIDNRAPVKIDLSLKKEEEILRKCMGEVQLAWLAPIYVRGRFTSILGLGVRNREDRKFNSEDFGQILDIISGEVGLSMENSRLYYRVQKEARTDSLTGIDNRRTIMKVLTSEFARFMRKSVPLTVAIFDLDHFKAINDNRGHLVGDEFLMETARILSGGIRESDYLGRYGGDEFIAIFPDTTAGDAQVIVERTRQNLIKYCGTFEGPDIKKKLSVSVGVAEADPSMQRADDLILLADNALYKAKEMGRDLCIVLEGSSPAPKP